MFEMIIGGVFVTFIWLLMFLAIATQHTTDRSPLWGMARRRHRLLRQLYNLDMRAAAVIPLLDIEEVEEVTTQKDHLVWGFGRDGARFDVSAWFRSQRKLSTRAYNNNAVREEQIFLQIDVTALPSFFPNMRLLSHQPADVSAQKEHLQALAKARSFEFTEQEGAGREMWLVFDSPQLGERVIALTPAELRALVAPQRSTSTETALVKASKPSYTPGPLAQRKLCMFERVDEKLCVSYMLIVNAGGASWHARWLMSQALKQAYRYASQLAIERTSEEEDFAHYAFRMVRDPDVEPASKNILLGIVLDLYQLRESSFYEDYMEQLEELVWQQQESLDLAALLPRMYSSFIDRYDTPALKKVAQRYVHEERLLNALIERSSKEEVLFDRELSWELREVVVIKLMRLKLSFMSQVEEWLPRFEPEDGVELLRVILNRGWFPEIWKKAWMGAEIDALIARIDHAELHAKLYHVLSSSRDAREVDVTQDTASQHALSFELFEKLIFQGYAKYLAMGKDFRADRARLLPLQALIQVMLRSNERDYAHEGWQMVLHHLDEPSRLLSVFGYPGLHERHQLEVMVAMLDHDEIAAMMRQEQSVRLKLLQLFELASVTHRAIAKEDFDRLAIMLFRMDEGIFETPAHLSRWDAMLKLYIRLVEEDRPRASALRALNLIRETMSRSQKAEFDAVVKRWQDRLGSRSMVAGALSVSSDGKRGGLSQAYTDEESGS